MLGAIPVVFEVQIHGNPAELAVGGQYQIEIENRHLDLNRRQGVHHAVGNDTKSRVHSSLVGDHFHPSYEGQMGREKLLGRQLPDRYEYHSRASIACTSVRWV